MPIGSFEPTVKVVNRVVRPDGTRVPYTAYFNGETTTFTDSLTVPVGIARILIHHSMYRQEPDTFARDYKLGCSELDAPEDDLPVAEVDRVELIDRTLLPPDRHFGAVDRFGRKLGTYRRVYRPMRHDPLEVANPREQDGAFPGSYGDFDKS